MTGAEGGLGLVQWMWRLLFSGLLCVPAIFMLVAGTWSDSAVPAPDLLVNPSVQQQQSYVLRATNLTISLPGPTPEPLAATPDTRKLPASTPVVAAAAPPQRSQAPRPRLELWHAAAPRQETAAPAHWALTHRPALWVAAANQDGGG